jgi:catechol 2,3-dioxygenase-like lactoylglutathione lyase family enzyme
MRVKHIDHIQMAMPPGGEARARAFYNGVLGIPEVPKSPELLKRGGCWFQDEGIKVHVGVETEFRAARKAHPALIVEGLRELNERIRAAGYFVKEDEPLEGYDRIYVDDPFGNRIELMEPHSGNTDR